MNLKDPSRPTRKLSVNVDHVATLKQARKTIYPDPLEAVFLCEQGGADGITLHLRGDRRHIQDDDYTAILAHTKLPVTLEMAPTLEMVELALRYPPRTVSLVPERPSELTTEGGLDAVTHLESLRESVERLKEAGIQVTLFLEPDLKQLEAAAKLGAHSVEIHTGKYAICHEDRDYAGKAAELERIGSAAKAGTEMGLWMNGGHGIHYHNALELSTIRELGEFSIGHGIVSRAVMVGMVEAVREMKRLISRTEFI